MADTLSTRISVRLTPQLRTMLAAVAKAEERTMGDTARRVLTDALGERLTILAQNGSGPLIQRAADDAYRGSTSTKDRKANNDG